MMILDLNQHDGHIHMKGDEYEQFKTKGLASKFKETTDGRDRVFVGCFAAAEPVAKMTPAMIRQKADDTGRIKVTFYVGLEELACSSTDGSLDGLNNIFNEVMDDFLVQDISYRVVGFTQNNELIVEANCDASSIIDDLHDYYFCVHVRDTWYLVGQDGPKFSGWDDGPKDGDIIAVEGSFEQICAAAAEYSHTVLPIQPRHFIVEPRRPEDTPLYQLCVNQDGIGDVIDAYIEDRYEEVESGSESDVRAGAEAIGLNYDGLPTVWRVAR